MQPPLDSHEERRAGHDGGTDGAVHTPPAVEGMCSVPEHAGISARFERLERELGLQQAEIGLIEAKIGLVKAGIGIVTEKIGLLKAQITRLHVVVTQHSAAARHMMVLVVAQAASDLEAMLTVGTDVREAGGLKAALVARRISPKTFWSLRGAGRTAIAYPPLDGLGDEYLARAAKDAYPKSFMGVLPIIAAFAVERRCACVRCACRLFSRRESPMESTPQLLRSPLC
jgi:hypothetical protein